MIYIASVAVFAIAFVLHLFKVPLFEDAVSIPIATLVVVGVLGFVGRFHPGVRKHMTRIVPKNVPFPGAMVWLTGFAEVAGAVGLLIEPLRPWAAAGFIVLFVCIFPANVIDAKRGNPSQATLRGRLVKRGLLQVYFVALSVWVLVASL